MSKKLAVLTNVVSPYRVPIFAGLGGRFETVIGIGQMEDHRKEWMDLDERFRSNLFRVVNVEGGVLQFNQDRTLHVSPGYLKFLFREKPDGVISWEMGFRTLCALTYSRLKRKPLWIMSEGTCHSDSGYSLLKKLYRCWLVRQPVRWICPGDASAEYLLSIGVKHDRIVQIQNTVDDTLFSPEGPKTAFEGVRPLVLVVGQLITRKGIEPMLESVHRLQQEGLEFSVRIIGSGPNREKLEAMIRDLPLKGIEIIGGLRPEEMPLQYRSADVLFFPTLEDVWGLVVNEALLSGTPAMSSKYAGCAYELLPEDNIFDPLDPEAMDNALRRAVTGQLSMADPSAVWSMDRIVETLVGAIGPVIEA